LRTEFSITLGTVRCHIRNYNDAILLHESVDQRPHKHYSMEFHCVFAGEETVVLPTRGKELQVTPGQILLLPPLTYHGVFTRERTVERLCFSFSIDDTENATGGLADLFRNSREPLLFYNPHAMTLVEECRRLRDRQDPMLAEERQGALLLSAVLELFSSLHSGQRIVGQPSSRTQNQQWLMEEHIEKHYSDDSGLAGLAEAMFLSQRQTRTLVQRFFGEDYKQLIIRRRMEMADIYLRDPNKSLEEIAGLVGYRSYSGFQLCFKRYFGMTPQEKRRQLAGHTGGKNGTY